MLQGDGTENRALLFKPSPFLSLLLPREGRRAATVHCDPAFELIHNFDRACLSYDVIDVGA